MSNRIVSLYQVTNNRTYSTIVNTYTPGSTIGAIPRSNRQALYRRASLNAGTIKNQKTGRCPGLCINYVQLFH